MSYWRPCKWRCAIANTYDIGDEVRITAVFTQQDIPIDPTTVALTLTYPDASSIVYTYAGSGVLRDSTGVYHFDIIPAARGTYRYKYVSTGAGTAAQSGWFQVRA
jgi:hypothetical protein